MTGPHQSILGRETSQVMETTLTFRPTIFHVAENDVRLYGTIVEVVSTTGRATSIRRLAVTESHAADLENPAPKSITSSSRDPKNDDAD
jgi:calcineurin-like phosphoesterase